MSHILQKDGFAVKIYITILSFATAYYILHYITNFCKSFLKFLAVGSEKMNICGIVCEYNPFHNGHLHQINEAHKAGADTIICVMSGNFVQRGDFAIMQKHARAKAAAICGADVVIELPLPYALSSAERFAYGAVSILENLGVVTHLSFGAECDELPYLSELARLLASGALDNEILEEYSKGVSYAAARESVMSRINPNFAEILRAPNNILAIEYLKALLRLNSEIKPIPIKRFAVQHDDCTASGSFASASHIRECMLSGKDISCFIPADILDIYKDEFACGHAPMSIDSASAAILSALKRLSADDFTKYSDVTEGLHNRLYNAVSTSFTLEDAITSAKTKRYAHSRIRRIFLNAFLDIDSSLADSPVPYARVLAFTESGRSILKTAKKSSRIPIITKPASIKFESKEAIDLLALERRSDDIYSLFMATPTNQGLTLKTSPIFVSGK